MRTIDNKEQITITLSGFDIKLILDALEEERTKRLYKTPWENRNPDVYPTHFWYDNNAKPVRQVDSTINFIKRQIEQSKSEGGVADRAQNPLREETIGGLDNPGKEVVD